MGFLDYVDNFLATEDKRNEHISNVLSAAEICEPMPNESMRGFLKNEAMQEIDIEMEAAARADRLRCRLAGGQHVD